MWHYIPHKLSFSQKMKRIRNKSSSRGTKWKCTEEKAGKGRCGDKQSSVRRSLQMEEVGSCRCLATVSKSGGQALSIAGLVGNAEVSHKLLLLRCLQDWLTPCLASSDGARSDGSCTEVPSPAPAGVCASLWSPREWAAGAAPNQK